MSVGRSESYCKAMWIWYGWECVFREYAVPGLPGQRQDTVPPVAAYRALWRWQYSSHWAKSALETLTIFTLNTTPRRTGLVDGEIGIQRFNIEKRWLPNPVSGARMRAEGILYG